MNILVTGGAGYIGSVLVPELLAQGHSVTVLDSLAHGGHGLLGIYGHPRFRFVKGDVREYPYGRRAIDTLKDAEAVVYLAALVGEALCDQKPTDAWEVNYAAAISVAKTARDMGVKRFLFASTCSNYGTSGPGTPPATEDAELNPLSLYAITKVRAEEALRELATDDFDVLVMRFATAYGLSPRMRLDLLLNEFALDAVDGRLEIYSPDAWRPFVHVRDIARFIGMALGTPWTYQTVNVGGHNWQKRTLAERLQELVPDVEVKYVEKKRDPRDYRVSYQRAQSLGFASRWTPRDGLTQVVAALRLRLFGDPHDVKYRNA